MIEIFDPVALVKYTLDTTGKIAHRQQLPAAPGMPKAITSGSGMAKSGTSGVMVGTLAMGGGGGGGAVTPGTERPQTTTEKLDTQTMEGVLVEGIRHTTTWPVGSQGNDRPISMINEIWMSPELKVTVMSKNNDPRFGESTMKLTNVSRAEPSASLFQPPPEYTVVDEAGDFTIKWGTQQ